MLCEGDFKEFKKEIFEDHLAYLDCRVVADSCRSSVANACCRAIGSATDRRVTDRC